MRPHWANLKEKDRAAISATIAFLKGRLEERATVDWALRLRPNDTIKRMALLDLIDGPDGQTLSEPWVSAWRLIEESWDHLGVEDDTSTAAYQAKERLLAGDRSGSLVVAIVELVMPRLKVESFLNPHPELKSPPKRPKKVEDLFSLRLTSGSVIDPDTLRLGDLTDQSFLLSLTLALDTAVLNGLDIARRTGWDGGYSLWPLGQLHRVYYVPVAERFDGDHEPDEFNRGIAASTKLLHAVVSRLRDVDVTEAIEFVRRWKLTNSPIHLRLWSALSRDPRVTPAAEVCGFLLSVDDRRFWDLGNFPEIAELRAARFNEFNLKEQTILTARIRQRPPRNQWPRKADATAVKDARLFWAVRELRRIEIAGAPLPQSDKVWLDATIPAFQSLVQMTRLDEGFIDSPRARWVRPNPDNRYDSLAGEERLKALEAALSKARRGWDDDPAERAADWIRARGNPIQILADLESIQDAGAAVGRVWERFASAHSPKVEQGEGTAQRDLPAESARVLSLLAKLPDATARQAIHGISEWLSAWQEQIVVLPEGLSVWLKLWPIAVDVTNAERPSEQESHLNLIVESSADSEESDIDTLNTPAGKLVGVFLCACPPLQENDQHPFAVGSTPRTMRDAIIVTTGRAGLIARYRMIESLGYFLRADRDWTQEQLLAPLESNNEDALALWRAVARQTRFSTVLKIIGVPMVERTTDQRLGRETRQSLVFSLVVECLDAFFDQREPAVPYTRIQQMIRALDDEVRAFAANTVQVFIRDVSKSREGEQAPPSPQKLFLRAAAPFLKKVWPQERSLATPGVSRALADLPATAKEAFAEAVDAIKRFLVPFECWSMIDYGLYGEKDGEPKLSIINNQEKAAAVLRLLDLTIGTAEGSVIPHDLADALDQIRRVTPNLTKSQEFRRLETAARRRRSV